jgi:hypothetical protein
MNAAINGSSDSNGDDYFRFPARKGERVILDCQGLRLDSTIRATLVLSTVAGKTLERSKPYYGQTDPFLDFFAPEDADYIVRLHDFTFSGGLPYRLIVSNRPQIESVFPSAVVPGEKTALTIYGRNLPGGKPDPQARVQGMALERLQVSYTAPRNAEGLAGYEFINHPPSPALTLRGIQVWPKGLENALNPATLVFADAPVTLEREPNDSAEKTQALKLPTVISGRFDKPGDADWYSFRLKAGEAVDMILFCERMEMVGDPYILVTDAKGKELASFDDYGINFNALAQFHRDPGGVFNAPADGTYRILVQDRYRRGGPRFNYALRLGKPIPDFYPVVFHETNPDPSCPVVRRGGSAFYELCLNRRNFNGPVTIEASGLPKGVVCPPVHVSPQSEFANVVFTAAADAPEWHGAIRLEAWATIDGKRVERPVRCAQRRWAIANINTSRVCRTICLAVRSQAPYRLKMPDEKHEVAAGESLEARIKVERLWPDFKGKLQIIGLNLPPGFNLATTDLPADKTEVALKLTVAGNVPVGTYSVVVRGDAQVPFARDGQTGKKNVRVADPSTVLTVLVTAAKKK